jgi:hypothetical protein
VDEADTALYEAALAIRDRVTDAMEQPSGAPLTWRLQDAAELITYGESVIGLENLCSNLHEFGVPLRAGEYRRIEAAGQARNVPAGTWTMLSAQVTPGPE